MLRYASPPDGALHVGELRVALLNYLVARRRGEGFMLWIDDTRPQEKIRARAHEIPAILEKFAIQPEQTLYARENLRRHQQLAVRLAEEKKAFLCLCQLPEEEHPYSGRCMEMSPEEIRQIREKQLPYTVRIRKPAQAVTLTDRYRGDVAFSPAQIDHFLLLRSDGSATGEFALACDEMTGGISYVIQEASRMLPAARQSHVRRSLGFDQEVEYAHLGGLLTKEGKPLRSPEGEYDVLELLRRGYLPDAILNYLLLLGYREPPARLFTLPEAMEWYDPDRLDPEPVPFLLEELRELNRAHLERLDDLPLSRLFRFADPDVGRVVKLFLREGAATLGELEERLGAIFSPKRCEGPHTEAMRTLSALILEAPMMGSYEEFVRYLQERSGLRDEALYGPLRLLMTGSLEGPDLSKIYSLLNPYITEIVRCQH